jgi:hypothetical protein
MSDRMRSPSEQGFEWRCGLDAESVVACDYSNQKVTEA